MKSLLQRSAQELSMAGAVMRPIALPAHAVSELNLVWRKHDAADQPVLARFTELMRGVMNAEPAAPPPAAGSVPGRVVATAT